MLRPEKVHKRMRGNVPKQKKNKNKEPVQRVIAEKRVSEKLQSDADRKLARRGGGTAPNLGGGSRRSKSNPALFERAIVSSERARSSLFSAGMPNYVGGAGDMSAKNRRNSPGMDGMFKTIMAPQSYSSRFAALTGTPTAIYPSLQVYDVYADVDAPAGGRFSASIAPIVGTAGNVPAFFKVAQVNPKAIVDSDSTPVDWAGFTDWGNANVYVNNQGQNVTKDQFADTMCGSPVSFQIVDGGPDTSLTPGNPFGTAPAYRATAASPRQVIGFTQVSGPDTLFSLPCGNWYVEMNLTGTTLTAAAFAAVSTNFTIIAFTSDVNSTNAEIGVFMTANPGSTGAMTFTVGASGATITKSFLYALPTDALGSIIPNQGQEYLNGGPVAKIRPCAMSVLYTSLVAPINDGGNVVLGCVPGDVANQNFFQQAQNDAGQFQLWEKLAQVKGCKSFKHCEGGYCFWKPETINTFDMRTVNALNAFSLPRIQISGFCKPNGISGVALIGRLIVACQWEFETSVNLWSTSWPKMNNAEFRAAYEAWLRMPNVCRNEEHENFVSSLLKEVGAVAREAIPVAKAGLMLGSMFL